MNASAPLQPPAPIDAPGLVDARSIPASTLARWSANTFLQPAPLAMLFVTGWVIGAPYTALLAFLMGGGGLPPAAAAIWGLGVAPVFVAFFLCITYLQKRLEWSRAVTDPSVRVYATADAVLVVKVSKRGTWLIANHVARQVGKKLGRPLQEAIAAPLRQQQVAAGVDVEAVSVVPKLQRHYVERWDMERVGWFRFVRHATAEQPDSIAAAGVTHA